MSLPLDDNGNVTIAYFAELQARARATLADGEVRLVASMETNAQRTVYIEGVREERGQAAALELRQRVWEYMQAHGIKHDEPQQEALFDGA